MISCHLSGYSCLTLPPLSSCIHPLLHPHDRACRPDCVFVRQHLKNLGDDYRPIILGLQYGNVMSVNPLRALYNFTDRPWVVSQRLLVPVVSLSRLLSLCISSRS